MNATGVAGKVAESTLTKLTAKTSSKYTAGEVESAVAKEYIAGHITLPVNLATEYVKKQLGDDSLSSYVKNPAGTSSATQQTVQSMSSPPMVTKSK